MNRRDFIKAAGFGTASLALPTSVLAAEERGDQILDEADARIEKHRKGDAVLRLLCPDGKALTGNLVVKIKRSRSGPYVSLRQK